MTTITALMTNNGAPYSRYTPTINIYNTFDGSLVVTSGIMTQINNTAIYKYDFTNFIYGTSYAYIISGDPSIAIEDQYQYGSLLQDLPDKEIGIVVDDISNSSIQFKTNYTSDVDNCWKDTLCLFLTGVLSGQVKKISAYYGSTGIIIVNLAFTTKPNAGDTFELINS
jgi:hypothetical protein